MAIKTLGTLVKLHKRHVDVLRREMVALEEERRQLLELAERLRTEYVRETQLAAEEPRVGRFFGAYAKHTKARQEAIAKEILRLDEAIETKNAAIREEFSEQKKYEIARENQIKKRVKQQQHREGLRFDEIGIQQYTKAEDQLS